MELVGALALVAGMFGAGVWLAVSRGTALRERDAALFKASGLADERDIASRKMRAQSKTILHLTSLMLESDVDPRVLAAAMSSHDRMLQEADRHPSDDDDLHTLDGPSASVPGAAEDVPGGGVLGRSDGEGSGPVSDPREDASG